MDISIDQLGENSSELEDVQWGSFDDLFDQSFSNFEGQQVDWATLNPGEVSDAPTNHQAVDHISGLSVDHPSPPLNQSTSISLNLVATTTKPKLKRGRKGRPKLNRNESDGTPTERRRTQVRMAQQAYRHRKEATLVSLRNDVENLKARLVGMERIGDELFQISCCSDLPERMKSKVKILSEEAEQYRLPRQMKGPTDPPQTEVLISSKSDGDGVIITSISGSTPLTAIDVNHSIDTFDNQVANEPNSTESSQQISPTSHKLHPINIHNFLEAGPTLRPSLWHFEISEQLRKTPLPFSLRLRHEALKCAYELITKHETSLSLLCRSFRYCIFSSTRDEIVRHVRFLLHESSKMAYRAFSNSPLMVTDLSGIDSSDGSLSLANSFTGAEMVKPELDESYMDPKGVEQYLCEKGLGIDPGSSFVTLETTSGNFLGNSPSLFDEIRVKRGIKISVSKLLHELLGRVVCLVVGPGIRVSDVDDAIRCTVIASI